MVGGTVWGKELNGTGRGMGVGGGGGGVEGPPGKNIKHELFTFSKLTS